MSVKFYRALTLVAMTTKFWDFDRDFARTWYA